MNKKYDRLSLNPITEEAYQKALKSQQFIDYSGPNADILIQYLPYPDVFFNDKIHVLIDKKYQDKHNQIINSKELDLNPDYMHLLTNNLFFSLERFVKYYNFINVEVGNGFYFFYEDWRFINYNYDLFMEENIHHRLLKSSNHHFLRPIECNLVYLGDCYDPDFRLINIYTAADILKSHEIEFKFDCMKQYFIIESSVFEEKKGHDLLGLCKIQLIAHQQLGNLLSRLINFRRQEMADAYDDSMDSEVAAAYDEAIETSLLKNN